MREIKCRAWNPEKNKFEIFELASHAPMATVEIPARGTWDKLEDWEQFIGLKDKDNKEIYEGDIVEYCDENGNKAKYNVEVIYSCGCFYFRDIDYIWKFPIGILRGEFEVIGNIHENKELLEKEE